MITSEEYTRLVCILKYEMIPVFEHGLGKGAVIELHFVHKDRFYLYKNIKGERIIEQGLCDFVFSFVTQNWLKKRFEILPLNSTEKLLYEKNT